MKRRTKHNINNSISWLWTILLMVSLIDLQAQVQPVGEMTTSSLPFQDAKILPGSGTLSFDIPLLSITSKGKTLPIFMNYNGAGIVVQNRASWVGQGWNLHTGGAVSRSIQGGVPDEFDDNSGGVAWKGYLNSRAPWPAEGMTTYNRNIYPFELSAACQDLQPDVFTLQTEFGFYGSFSFERTPDHFVPIDEENIDVFSIVDYDMAISSLTFSTSEIGKISAFKMYNNSGLKFDFEVPEYMQTSVKGPSGYQFPGGSSVSTTWHLSKVRDETDAILFDFDYSDEAIPIDLKNYHASLTASAIPNSNLPYFSSNEYTIGKRYIERIDYDEGYVLFIKDAVERTDLEGHYALKYIKHYNNAEILLEEIEFGYSYQTGHTPGNVRLFLTNIKRKNGTGQEIEKIEFDYNWIPLPDLYSAKIDFWGYFNGSSNNSTASFNALLTRGPHYQETSALPASVVRRFTGKFSDREPSEVHSKAGVLESVRFSSGKSLLFDYELNEYSYLEDTDHPLENQKSGFFYGESQRYLSGNDYKYGNIQISVQHNQWVFLVFSKGSGCSNSAALSPYSGIVTNNKLMLPNGQGTWAYLEEGVTYTVYPQGTSISPCPAPNPTGVKPSITVNYKYHDDQSPESFRKKGGGLRLKRIIEKDNNGSAFSKNFIYDDFVDSKKSSGILAIEPNKAHLTGQIMDDNLNYHNIYTQISSSPSSEVIRSHNVVYTNIEEFVCKVDETHSCITDTDSRDQIGRTKNTFIFFPRPSTYPFLPSILFNTHRVVPSKTEILNTSDQKVQVREWFYSFYDDGDSFSKGAHISKFDHSNLIAFNNWVYVNNPSVLLNTLERVEDYESNEVINTTERQIEFHAVSANPDIVKLPKTTYTSNSDGSAEMTKKSYSGSFDFQNLPAGDAYSVALKNLIDQKRYTEPVEEIVYFRSSAGSSYRPISRKIYLYSTLASGKVVLDQVVNRPIINPQSETHNLIELIGTTTLTFDFVLEARDEVTKFKSYHDGYIPQEKITPNNTASAVLLNENSLPVAQVENGQLASTRYTSFEDGYHGGWEPQEDFTTVTTGPAYAISGDHYYRLDGNQFNSMTQGVTNNKFASGTYLLSYYSTGNETIFFSANNEVISESSKVVGEWIYNEKVVRWTSNDNWVTISGTGFIDELRFHEIDAVMTTQGFYPDGKLKYKASPSGDVVTYEYDSKGRIEWVLDIERFALQNHEYQEKNILDEDSYNSHTNLTARREEMTKDELTGNDADFLFKSKTVVYTDGFGRHRQTVDAKATFNGKDVVSFSDYDDFGRALKKYLPYVVSHAEGTHGPFRPNFENEQAAYYSNDSDIETTQYPFSEVELEASPLQRPIEQGGVGETFQLGEGHNVEMEYGWNAASEVRKWTYNHTTGKVSAAGYYPAGVLQCVKTTDQNGVESAQWTDARGRAVASGAKVRVTGTDFNTTTSGGPATTYQISYTVYDDFGRVVMEISAYANAKMPALNFEINPLTALHKELLAWYKYDAKGRVIERHSPGLLGATHYVYNKYDQLVMSQTYAQRITNPKLWTFSKYDSRQRLILSGECVNSATRATLQSQVDADPDWNESKASSGGVFGYTNYALPSVTEADVFNAYFFDDYDFDNGTLDYTAFDGFAATEMTRGMPTGSKTRVFMDGGAPVDFLTTVSYYDDKGRPLQAYTENHKGGYDRIDTWYNEYGQVDKTKQTHLYESTSDAVEFTTSYNYHPRTGQLKDTYVAVNDDSQVLVSQKYYKTNGSLSSNKLHKRMGPTTGGSNFMQVLTYRYNERGQLTHINNPSLIVDAYNFEDYDVFGQEITYESHSLEEYDNQLSEWEVIPQYNGNISSMIWNTKDPEADGAMEQKHAYVYEYDDIGNLIAGLYAAEHPSTPGTYNLDGDAYTELIGYNLGGNVKNLTRFRKPPPGTSNPVIDDLTYTYYTNSYRLMSVGDGATQGQGHIPNVKHFINGASSSTEYTYDSGRKITNDANRKTSIAYNRIHLPSTITPYGLPGSNEIKYMYDAAGNRLQKYVKMDDCDPATQLPCNGITETRFDYIGNFVYENGELKMIYHPEGVIRPTPPSAENDTEFVFDYFIKDYLGNVRVVMTEEDATYTDKFLATLEDVHAYIEEINFENLEEVREDLPTGYPVNGSVSLNERIALLNAANGTEIGPSIVLPVKQGEKVSLSTEYFYTEDAAGATYDNIDFLINEVLIAFAAGGSGILPLNETQLIDIASGQGNYSNALANLFNNEIDTTDMSRPYAYMVWTAYDANMNIIPSASGIERVSDPNDLEVLIREEIAISADGFLHAYVSNGSAVGVNFDNFQVTTMRGKVRQINHYYPYGLTISGIGTNSDEYLNKYTTKELQTGEWNPAVSNGLEMYDFHARHYDPQLGRWFAPDPAEQFSNPYLAMGNNPVMYVDPDGEFIIFAVAAGIGGVLNLVSNFDKVNSLGSGLAYFANGAIGGAVSVVNPLAGGSLTAGLNVAVDIATGNLPDFKDANDVANYAAMTALGALTVGSSGSLAKGIGQTLGANWYQTWAGYGVSTRVGAAGSASFVVDGPSFTISAKNIGGSVISNAAKGGASKLPTQIHHFATNKSKTFTPRMAEIADEFGLSLNGAWNKQALPHLGRHPNEYHKFVLEGMQNAKAGAAGSQTEFINLFNQYVKQPVIQNPGLLRKLGW